MSREQLTRSAGLVMVLVLISRLLGFVRERAIAEVFGRTWETDAFRAAFNIPDLMYVLLVGGAISAAFLPVFTEYLAKGEEEEGWRLAATFMTGALAFLVAFAVVGAMAAPALAPLVAYGLKGEQGELLVFLMRMMFPAVFFTALAGVAMGVHHAYRRFTSPMVGPIVYNVAIIAGAYVLGPRMGITGMAVGTVVGAVGNFLVQLPFVWKKARPHRWQPNWRHPGLARIFRMMGPALVGLAIFQINLIIITNMASGLDEGSITALNLANRLMQLPLGVFGMALGTVLFPTLARLSAQENWEEFQETLSFGLRGVLFVTIPAAAGLLALGEPVVRLLFEAGEFGPQDTAATAYALTFFAVAVIGLSGVQIVTRTFYALHDTRTPVKAGVVAVIVNTTVAATLLRFTPLQHGGLALAYALAAAAQLAVGLFFLRRRLPALEVRPIAASALRAGAAAIVMALGAFAASQLVGARVDLTTVTGRLVQVGAGVAAGVILYVALASAFRLEEMAFAARLFRRRRQPQPSTAQAEGISSSDPGSEEGEGKAPQRTSSLPEG